MNRGSDTLQVLEDLRMARFNEAPIHESGKYAFALIRRFWPTASFNEAPIHESGKFGRTSAETLTLAASMRPRFMNRGSVPQRLPVRGLHRGFNEAPIHESGK